MTLPPGFVDIHAHVIPALDDGPADLDTALALVRAAGEDGTGVMVATGHSAEIIQHGGGAVAMERRLDVVRSAAAQAGLTTTLLLGVEIYLEPDTLDRLQRGDVFPLNGSRYVLIELPFATLPLYLDQALFQLQAAGYTPIIAHPERNASIQRDARPLFDWVMRGALLQVSAASLTGGFGRHAARVARLAIERRLCHAVASDGHDPTRRPPHLQNAFFLLRDEFNLDVARTLLDTQPRAIVEDRQFTPPEPLPLDGPPARRLPRPFRRS